MQFNSFQANACHVHNSLGPFMEMSNVWQFLRGKRQLDGKRNVTRVDAWCDTNGNDTVEKKQNENHDEKYTRHGRFGWLLEHFVNEKHVYKTHMQANRMNYKHWAHSLRIKFIGSLVKQLHTVWHKLA